MMTLPKPKRVKVCVAKEVGWTFTKSDGSLYCTKGFGEDMMDNPQPASCSGCMFLKERSVLAFI